jgi:HAD superfamily hydrolase (TIGR01662 family)
MPITTVFFDAGETLVNETRQWSVWVDWLGVTPLTFFAALGAVIERRQDHRRVVEVIRPESTWERERVAMAADGLSWDIIPADFYPDALSCLQSLQSQGYRLGIAGNQPAATERILREMGLPVDIIATSQGWGVEKPSPAFFARVAQEAGRPPAEIAYVGDRMDNDILPAQAAGMLGVFLRRGPWGHIHATQAWDREPDIRLEGLDALPAALAHANLSRQGER